MALKGKTGINRWAENLRRQSGGAILPRIKALLRFTGTFYPVKIALRSQALELLTVKNTARTGKSPVVKLSPRIHISISQAVQNNRYYLTPRRAPAIFHNKNVYGGPGKAAPPPQEGPSGAHTPPHPAFASHNSSSIIHHSPIPACNSHHSSFIVHHSPISSHNSHHSSFIIHHSPLPALDFHHSSSIIHHSPIPALTSHHSSFIIHHSPIPALTFHHSSFIIHHSPIPALNSHHSSFIVHHSPPPPGSTLEFVTKKIKKIETEIDVEKVEKTVVQKLSRQLDQTIDQRLEKRLAFDSRDMMPLTENIYSQLLNRIVLEKERSVY